MAINVSQSFHRTSANAVDDTFTLTKAQMLAVNDNLMPAKYLTVCQDDGFIYLYDKSATPNETTGKFTKFEGGSGVTDYSALTNKPKIGGVTLTGNKTASDLGLATDDEYSGSTAGLVPAAGSDNEGKYLDNDGNWTVVPMPMIGTINRSDIYDTTEKVVGKWTDGRPIYQKTITGTLTNTTQEETVKATFASLEASIQEFVDIHGVIFTDAGKCIQMSVTQLSSNQKIDVLRMVGETNSSSSSEKNGIHIYNSWYTSGTNTYKITARYTKTTDAANSYNYADENDYSTSEKIIGKWIDGKTLYQKTIDVGALPNATTKKVAHNISGLSKVVSISGVATNGIAALTLPDVDPNSIDNATRVLCTNNGEVQLTNKVDRSSFNGYVTLKYTKS